MAFSGEIIKSPRSTKALDFIVPHDGSQDPILPEQQERASDKFSSLVDDTFLSHLDKVTTSSSGESRMVLGSKVTSPGVKWKLRLTKKTDDFEPFEGIDYADQTVASIELAKHVNGRPKEQFSYRLGADGVVRRHTVDDIKERNELQRGIQEIEDLKKRGTEEDQPAGALEVLNWSSRQAAENRKLERKMGVNMQPVGEVEVNGLADFIADSGFEAPNTAVINSAEA